MGWSYLYSPLAVLGSSEWKAFGKPLEETEGRQAWTFGRGYYNAPFARFWLGHRAQGPPFRGVSKQAIC